MSFKKAYLFVTEYLLFFALASCIGWLYEMVCVWLLYGYYFDRGVLHLPMCPIYGFGILLLMLVLRSVKNPFGIFLGSFLIASGVELVSSYILEYGFHKILWSYEGWPLSFQDRISIVSSIIFGVMATVFIKLVKPPIDKLFRSKYGTVSAVIVTMLFIAAVSWEMMHR
ncbi:MAG: putative ABC transporter permease [Lachnospiraceae bacterium]|nr:putative ABC transporter permease [Lachnospiraceae bacterium]